MKCSAMVLVFALANVGAAFAADDPPKVQAPVTDKRASVSSAVNTPITDLNLKKTPIPDVLQRATADPYDAKGLDDCNAIAAEVASLDAALGADRDAPPQPAPDDGKGTTVATVLQTGVQAVIPYRGVVRQISGANARERTMNDAIQVGFARRGFLKGRAQEMNCPAGASPAGFQPVPKLPDAPIDAPPAVATAAPLDIPAPPVPLPEALAAAAPAEAPGSPPPAAAPEAVTAAADLPRARLQEGATPR